MEADGLSLDAAGVIDYLAEVWPESKDYYRDAVSELTSQTARITKTVPSESFRPGGTVSGPFMMVLADSVTYFLLLGILGRQALTVTTSLNMDFLRRPAGPMIAAEAQLEKMGRSLAVVTVRIGSCDHSTAPDFSKPEAIAKVTYSLALTT